MRNRIVATIVVAIMIVSSCSVILTSSAQNMGLPSNAVLSGPSMDLDIASRDDSSRAFNQTEHMGYTTSPPSIDGTWSAIEWQDAAVYNIGPTTKPVDMYIMFDDANIYVGIDAISDNTQDGGDPPGGQVTSTDTDYFLITFDGDNDAAITYQNYWDDFFMAEQPSEDPWTRGGQCVDRGASTSGGSYRVAGWWHWNLDHTGYVLWSGGSPNTGTTEPYDYIAPGWTTNRVYEYSIPYTGTGDELGLFAGDTVNIGLVVNDAKGGGTPGLIGRIPGGAGGVGPPYQPFMLNGKPKAVITPLDDTLVYSGVEIQFDASSSSDPEGETLTYKWDFDYNGPTFDEDASGMSQTHTFDSDGTYTVALKVEDTNGAADMKKVALEAIEEAEPPVISNQDPATNPTIEEGEKITFSADYDDPNLDKAVEHLYVEWLVDDQVVKSSDSNKAGSTSFSIQTGFTDADDFPAGEYKVDLKVNDTYDALGKWTEGSQETVQNWTLTVTNLNRAPTIDSTTPVETTPQTDENEPLQLSVTASDPDGDNLLYQWFVDDAPQAQATLKTFIYLQIPDYTAAGPHNVKVVVKDNGVPQLQDEFTWNVIVYDVNRLPTIQSTTPTGKTVRLNEGDSENFKVTASDPDPGDTLEYLWYLDDDIMDDVIGTTYTFETDYESATGEDYILKVEAFDGKGSDTHEWTITVSDVDRPPQIVITQPEEGARYKLSELVTFNARQTVDLDGDPLTYEWYFGDDSSKLGSEAKHTYEYPGEYTAELYVTSKHNGQDLEFLRIVNLTIDAATIEVVTITTDVYEVTEGSTVTITTEVRNSGTIDAEDAKVKLYMDGTTLIETRDTLTIGAGALEEYVFEWKARKTGVHTFTIVLEGDADTLINDEKKVESDEVEVKKKVTPIGIGGVDGEFPFWIILLLVILVIIILGVAIGARSSKRKRLAAEERKRQEEEKQRQEAEAQAAATQTSMYAEPEQQAYQEPAMPLPPPPPPPPPTPAASPFVSRRAKRQREREMEEEAPSPKKETKVVTPEMAKVAAEAGVCPACGDEVETDWPRCLNCGEKLIVLGQEPEPPKESPPPPPPPPPPPAPKAEAKPEVACPKCGEEVESDWAKCPSCAHSLKAPPSAVEAAGPKCGKCGEEIEADWLKCPSCGTSTKGEDPDKASEAKALKCPSCGEDVEPDWAKCPFCSKPI